MSHKGNDEIIDNERDNISTYYEMIKHFENLKTIKIKYIVL